MVGFITESTSFIRKVVLDYLTRNCFLEGPTVAGLSPFYLIKILSIIYLCISGNETPQLILPLSTNNCGTRLVICAKMSYMLIFKTLFQLAVFGLVS